MTTRTRSQGLSQNNTENEALRAGKTMVNTRQNRRALGDLGNVRAKAAPVQKEQLSHVTGRKRTDSPAFMETKKAKIAESEDVIDLASPERAKEEQQVEEAKEKSTPFWAPIRFEGYPEGLEDIDRFDRNNEMFCTDYVNEVYICIHRMEKDFKVEDYMGYQPAIKPRMRAILVDWLVDVHIKFKLLAETLYLTVNIIDRYLERRECEKNHLQLVGVTAMLIASKYEEIFPPEVNDFVWMTDQAYSSRQILEKEHEMIQVLDFAFGDPLPPHFLRRCSKSVMADALTHTMAKYIMELSLIDYKFIHFLKSEIAAASLWLSIHILNVAEWNDTTTYYSRYEEHEIKECILALVQAVRDAMSPSSKFKAVYKKYQATRFGKIAQYEGIHDFVDAFESNMIPDGPQES
eukprot:Clim_evm6s156 gene=Clim_evmTU6s156